MLLLQSMVLCKKCIKVLKSAKTSWRPITLLPTLSKVAESIMHKRLLAHFMENNVISDRQAAYLKGDSTIQQLLYIVHLIRTTWTKNKIIQGVFLDAAYFVSRIVQ